MHMYYVMNQRGNIHYRGDDVMHYLELAYPQNPSSLYNLGNPSLKVLLHPSCVWIRTFKASHGARPMSAKNSALAEAAK